MQNVDNLDYFLLKFNIFHNYFLIFIDCRRPPILTTSSNSSSITLPAEEYFYCTSYLIVAGKSDQQLAQH